VRDTEVSNGQRFVRAFGSVTLRCGHNATAGDGPLISRARPASGPTRSFCTKMATMTRPTQAVRAPYKLEKDRTGEVSGGRIEAKPMRPSEPTQTAARVDRRLQDQHRLWVSPQTNDAGRRGETKRFKERWRRLRSGSTPKKRIEGTVKLLMARPRDSCRIVFTHGGLRCGVNSQGLFDSNQTIACLALRFRPDATSINLRCRQLNRRPGFRT